MGNIFYDVHKILPSFKKRRFSEDIEPLIKQFSYDIKFTRANKKQPPPGIIR